MVWNSKNGIIYKILKACLIGIKKIIGGKKVRKKLLFCFFIILRSDTQSEIVVKQKDIDTDSDGENKTDYETDNKNSGSNGISNNTMGKNTGSITVKEPDKANSQISLPKTGKQSNIIIALSVLIIMVSYYSYKKYMDLKNI